MDEIHNWNRWIGTDEAGKGDYFGPLVVAGVYVDCEIRDELLTQGITDGKKVSNPRIRKLGDWMWNHYSDHIAIAQVMPNEYNPRYECLHENGDNLNTMLADLHIEVIKTLADVNDVNHALIDQFARNGIIETQLQKYIDIENNQDYSDIEILEIPKAERDIAVAAASIIARDAFLNGIEALSQQYKISLPRGSYQVVDAGKAFVRLHGIEALSDVAKLHFRLTESVIS